MSLLQSLGYGLDSFFEPALMPTSPWALGVNGIRVGGHAVILFGDALPGFTGKQADDLMDLLRGRSPLATPTTRPTIEPTRAEEWLRWWVDRINNLLGLILDPSNYQDQNGFYDPGRHLGVLASIEELFSSVQTILADAQKPHHRIRRLFEVIDLLTSLTFGSWESLLRPDRIRREMERLKAVLPAGLQSIALARCVPAIEALDAFGNHFGPRDPDGLLIVRSSANRTKAVPIDAAIHTYLRIIRNSGPHSFGEAVDDPYRRSILASCGEPIPDAIADLGFFHLLRFLQTPRIPRLSSWSSS
jgi:hypothetical protein